MCLLFPSPLDSSLLLSRTRTRISFARARQLADQNNITEMLFPLFEENIQSFLYHPDNYARTAAVVAAANERHQVRPIRDLPRQRIGTPTGGPPPPWQPVASGLPAPSDDLPGYPQGPSPLTSPDVSSPQLSRMSHPHAQPHVHPQSSHNMDRRHSLPASFYQSEFHPHPYANSPQLQQQQHLPMPSPGPGAGGGSFVTHGGPLPPYPQGDDSFHHHRPPPLQLDSHHHHHHHPHPQSSQHHPGQGFFPGPPLSTPLFQSNNKRMFDEYDDGASPAQSSSHHSVDGSNASSPNLGRGGVAPLTPMQPSSSLQGSRHPQQQASPATVAKRSRVNSAASDGGSAPNIEAAAPGKVRLLCNWIRGQTY
jgi:hypothetical protein